jgi:hypothetical protein
MPPTSSTAPLSISALRHRHFARARDADTRPPPGNVIAGPSRISEDLPRPRPAVAHLGRAPRNVSDPLTQNFFGRRFSEWQSTYQEEAIGPMLNKIDAFLSGAIRNVIGQ